ncbi:ATP-binding protein [Patescibacteria group bacterium]|nr:ATP-binding protein [Patescibacteria group bacterium]MBU1662995.1 ATP-binding protein [Patescibacteria group bacterium]MBU1934181.1 ATP-binding protein [Patescibacteria group bacterium]MBU2263783.1 ATP-binding protein [Patescibacteria group bacterium]
MYYKREIENKIKGNLQNSKAIIITGMRRVGKTTLMKRLYEQVADNKIWFDFENPLDIKHFEDIDYNDVFYNITNKINNFNKKKKIYVFIDEAQHYPKISKIVKYLIDHYNVKFILTGSASYYLKNLFPESLAGRKIIFEMYPLNFEEFLVFKQQNIDQYKKIKNKKNISGIDYKLYDKYYDEFVHLGSFPEVVLAENLKEKKTLLNDIFSSYFQNEIINLADYRKNDKIRDLILLLTARVGSKLDLVKLSQELQIHRATIYSYLSFLQATYFIHLVPKFSTSIDREVSGMQKVYFCDNGILKIMASVNFGQLFENAIYNQLKTEDNLIHYYQKSTGAEIDFIVNKKFCYEVKATATNIDVQQLKRKMSLIKLKNGAVVSKNYTDGLRGIKFGQFL